MIAWKQYGEGKTPKSENIKGDKFVGVKYFEDQQLMQFDHVHSSEWFLHDDDDTLSEQELYVSLPATFTLSEQNPNAPFSHIIHGDSTDIFLIHIII